MCFLSLNIVDESNSRIVAVLRSEGIFDRFLQNYLDILSTAFTGKELVRYCRMMSRELNKMEFRYTERLAKHFKRLSKKHRDEIVDEMAEYRREYDEKTPTQLEFYDAINQAFTLQHNLKFVDYIHSLLAFGKGDLLFVSIQELSRNILQMIVNCIEKMGQKELKDLEKKLKRAIKEYTASH